MNARNRILHALKVAVMILASAVILTLMWETPSDDLQHADIYTPEPEVLR